jgi:hypothetical protein
MNENFSKIIGNDIDSNLVNLSQLVLEVTGAYSLRCKYRGYGELCEGDYPHGRGSS